MNFPFSREDLDVFARAVKTKFAVITFGIPDSEWTKTLANELQSWVGIGLRACVHYCPSDNIGRELVVKNVEGKYIP